MAAAEYYNPGIPQQQGPPPPNMNTNQNLRPPTQAPPLPMQNNSPNPSSLPYPLSDAPPPYSAFADQQRPQSQPPPSQRPPQPQQGYANGGGPVGGYQPYQNGDTHTYPPDKIPPQQRPGLQNTYRPSDYTSQHPIPPPPQQIPPAGQQNGFVRPGLSSLNYPGKEVRFNTQQRPSSQPAPTGYNNNNKPSPDRYNPSPERYRSRSRSRERRNGNGGRRHHSHRPEHNRPDGYYKPSTQEKKKGSSASTFLGAGGGALIGDMIFPGLGTLGGAILGGVGGHEYSKEKKRSVGYAGQRSYSHGDGGGGGGRDVYYEDEYRRGRR